MKIVKGNLLTLAKHGQFDIIAHGCNCQNIMSAGIAKQIAEEFPDAFLLDKEYKQYNGEDMMMGNFSQFYYNDEHSKFWIINCYTQMWPGAPSPGCLIPFDYEAFTVICRKINHTHKGRKIGLPWIGCGLAQANKLDVSHIIVDELADMDVTIVEYENNKELGRPLVGAGLGDAPTAREVIDNESKRARGEKYVAGDSRGQLFKGGFLGGDKW